MEKVEEEAKRQLLICDAHCHLIDYFDMEEIDGVVKRSREKGIVTIIENATSRKTFGRVMDIYERHREVVVPSIGYHPYYLEDLEEGWEEE